jgi:multiple sugar transport system permease protein
VSEKRRKAGKSRVMNLSKNTILFFFVLGAMFVTLFPVYWIVTTGFKNPIDVLTYPPSIVPFINFIPTLDNWRRDIIPQASPGTELALAAHGGTEIQYALLHSLIISSGATLFSVIIGSFAGYALARFQFKRWKNEDMAFFVLSQRFLPAAAIVIPYFIMFKNLGLLDTYPTMILVDGAMTLPFSVWMMREYFLEVPKEIEESALIDGCSIFATFRRIVLPLSMPGLVSTAVFCFIFAWNEFLMALFLTFSNANPITLTIAGMTHSGAPLWWDISALGTITVIPPIALALLVQRYIVRGLSLGAVKG